MRCILMLLTLAITVNSYANRKDLSKADMAAVNAAVNALPEIKEIEKHLGDTSFMVVLPLGINVHDEPLSECVYIRVERRRNKDWDAKKPASTFWDAYLIKYDRINKKVVRVIKE